MTDTPESGTPTATPTVEAAHGRPSRLIQALAWVGIVAGGLFIAAGIFFSGYFLSWGSGDHMDHGTMACCDHMKTGGQMGSGGMMAPGGTMPPHSATTPTP